jgi:hypothetical protein
MSIAIDQKPNGREFNETSGSIRYIASCDAGEDDTEVKAAVEAEAPSSYMGLGRTGVFAQEINVDADGNPMTWDVRVDYGRRGGRLQIPQTGDIIWSGSTLGGTQRITSPLAPGTPYTDPSVTELPEDWGNAIGVTKDSVEGADIVVPVDAFQATMYIRNRQWPIIRGYIKAMTGSVNDDDWEADGEDFEAGEVLFLGATWQKRTEVDPHDYEVTFHFAGSPNVEDLTVGGITVEEKQGWDYLDITYESEESGAFLIKKPIIATVHKVYRRSNFDLLGLE